MKQYKTLLLILVFLQLLFAGCIRYVRGDLNYIDKQYEQPKGPQTVAYRINVNAYCRDEGPGSGSVYFETRPFEDSKKMISERFKIFLDKNKVPIERAIGLKLKDCFLNISLVHKNDANTMDRAQASFCAGFCLTLYPSQTSCWDTYYAIDIYDKRVLDKIIQRENAKNRQEIGDSWNADGTRSAASEVNLQKLNLSGIQPLGSFEYKRGMASRLVCLPLTPILPNIFDSDRAFGRILDDMNKEFLSDIQNGFNSIMTHGLTRDGTSGVGMVMSPEQVGDSGKEQLAMIANTAMYAASAAQQISAHPGGFKHGMISAVKNTAIGMAKEYAVSVIHDEVNKRLSDEQKNIYIALVKSRNENKWLFAGAGQSLRSLRLKDLKDKDRAFKVGRKYFTSKSDFSLWMQKQDKLSSGE